jgi:hypothetical protein
LKDDIKKFILNDGVVNTQSENTTKAVMFLKIDRSTNHEAFITSLDGIQGASFLDLCRACSDARKEISGAGFERS